jgi:hypothetical protein
MPPGATSRHISAAKAAISAAKNTPNTHTTASKRPALAHQASLLILVAGRHHCRYLSVSQPSAGILGMWCIKAMPKEVNNDREHSAHPTETTSARYVQLDTYSCT